MTVPIQVPIITTSPPAALPAKATVKPEKTESFEQILKQKTCESAQEGKETGQADQVVKDQPNSNIQKEAKPVKEDTKLEEQKEAGQDLSGVIDQRPTETPSQSIPIDMLTSAVPVVTLVIESVVVGPAPAQPSETNIESGMDVVEASPVSISGTANSESSNPAVSAPELKAETNGAQEIEFRQGKDPNAKPVTFQEAQSEADLRTFSSGAAIKPMIQQADANQQEVTEVRSGAGEAAPQPEQTAETVKQAIGQTVTNVPAESSSPEQTIQVKASNNKAPQVEEQNVNNLADASPKPDSKTVDVVDTNKATFTVETADVKVEVKADLQVKNIKTDTAPEGKVPVQAQPVLQAGSDTQTKDVYGKVNPERKLETQPPPEASESAPPTVSPGVIQEQIKMDPFTGKINEPARLAEAQTTEILRQISRQVAGSSGTGSQSIRIQLHPEDLGQIDLRISTGSLGTHVTLIADQSSTGKLLETHIDQLKQTLADAGIQMANVHVGQQSDQRSFRDPQYGQNTARQNTGYSSPNSAVSEELPVGQSRSRSSLVDYRI